MMRAFVEPLEQWNAYEELQNITNGVVQVSGCMDAQKPHLIYTVDRGKRAKLIVSFSEQRAKEIYEDYKFFDRNVVYYPAKDFLFYQSDVCSNELVRERICAVKQILEDPTAVIVTTVDAIMNKMIRPELFIEAVCEISEGLEIDPTELQNKLVELGYERVYQVENYGQFAVRGGIFDIFPLTEENPYRVEFIGDEIDTIRYFDVESQRSIERQEMLKIYPAAEVILTEDARRNGVAKLKKELKKVYDSLRKDMRTEEAYRLRTATEEIIEAVEENILNINIDMYLNYFTEETVPILEYFSEDAIVFIDEPARVAEKGRGTELEFSESMKHRLEKGYILPGQVDSMFDFSQIAVKLMSRGCIAMSTLDLMSNEFEVKRQYSIDTRMVNPYNNSFEMLLKDLKQYNKKGYKTILLSGSRTRAKRLTEDLQSEGLSVFYTEDLDHEVKSGEIMVTYGKVRRGYEYPMFKFVVISESDIFGSEKRKKKRRKQYEGEKIQSFTDLSIGDYVVHENHGLGIYRGIEKVVVDKTEKDYIKIEYAKGGNLYILATQLELIQKYAKADAKKPKLNRLGGQEWARTKIKVRGAVKEIAKELVELYAIRQNKQGFQYDKDNVWQQEFEELFPFEETEDQMLAIEATKRDMESPRIMDRLICGDVGYGKTEIAIRAAFKAVQDDKQVVYLVPTTILAQQIYNTFSQRMKDYPINIELMCRFRTSAQQKKTVTNLKNGQCDIVVGTHRVLSKDVGFKDLGLLIIDEEQRFGVTHKEKIKQLKKDVDVLTLTATPIPRTLHMSLIGIRDMSVLEEPPMERVPIQTYVMEYNEELVREAINRELARDGQVYYVFNRVNQIEEITAKLSELLPDAVVTYAHGQMKERELEDIMYRFINGEIDVLVSTTIIETGLDISNVNTMIIHDADNLGLSQLYQLRGRVGRSNRTAYAFLLYRRDKLLKEVAEKRLAAIKEFTDLGSGFKIAMRDLEIRGAGNLLGAQQHGHMEAVGYDLYCKMLNQAVKNMQGIESEAEFDTSVDIEIDAFIPPRYIKNEMQKLDIYKRIAGIMSEEDRGEIEDELIDRFGDMPRSVTNLLDIARIKADAHKIYFTDITQKGDIIKFTFYESADIDISGIQPLVDMYEGRLKFIHGTKGVGFSYDLSYNSRQKKENVIEVITKLLSDMAELLLHRP